MIDTGEEEDVSDIIEHLEARSISLPHKCGVSHHTVGVYTSIGLMRYNGFTADDMQN